MTVAMSKPYWQDRIDQIKNLHEKSSRRKGQTLLVNQKIVFNS